MTWTLGFAGSDTVRSFIYKIVFYKVKRALAKSIKTNRTVWYGLSRNRQPLAINKVLLTLKLAFVVHFLTIFDPIAQIDVGQAQ